MIVIVEAHGLNMARAGASATVRAIPSRAEMAQAIHLK